MKTKYYLQVFVAAILISLGMSSCGKEEIPDSGSSDSDEYVEVSLKCGGDIADMGVTPLSRVSGTDLYYIQALVEHDIDGQKRYIQYAHGLFNDISNLSIRLKKNENFFFRGTMIRNGAELIYNDNSYYFYPFNALLSNSFVNDALFDIDPITYGNAHVKSGDYGFIYYRNPPLERYYGETGLITAVENVTVSLPLYSMSFQIRVVPNNLTKGSIIVSLDGAPTIVVYAGEVEKTQVLSLWDLLYCYRNIDKGYEEKMPITVEWIDTEGTSYIIEQSDMSIYRNKIKNIYVHVPEQLLNQ